MALLRTIGTMSGTSMDGIDVAFVETDGQDEIRLGPTGFMPYEDADRLALRAALDLGPGLTCREDRPGAVAHAEHMVTQRHAQAVSHFLKSNSLRASEIDVVGFHGQTIIHRPKERLTVQIGDGLALARSLQIAVAHDFRAADMQAGGEGAPIVPVFHRALVAATGLPGPLALLNVGGVANVTYIDDGSDPIACDTGPGNALLDDLMFARAGEPMDRHGHTAARGRVDERALAALLVHPFFFVPPPKSLDRNAFSSAAVAHLALEDAAATLTAFTAASVGRLIALLPKNPKSLIVCGGGARNPILVRELVNRLPCAVTTADVCGWSADAMEAQAFGYLAARTTRKLPLTFPTTTGVPAPTSGGRMALP